MNRRPYFVSLIFFVLNLSYLLCLYFLYNSVRYKLLYWKILIDWCVYKASFSYLVWLLGFVLDNTIRILKIALNKNIVYKVASFFWTAPWARGLCGRLIHGLIKWTYTRPGVWLPHDTGPKPTLYPNELRAHLSLIGMLKQ